MTEEQKLSRDGLPRSGIPGLDAILCGGFPRNNVYLIEGAPGAGKTTLALQFLLEGARDGERCLYITLSETERELRAVGATGEPLPPPRPTIGHQQRRDNQ